jgi:hypothetical protein
MNFHNDSELVVGRWSLVFAIASRDYRCYWTPERTLLAASHNVQQTINFIEADGLAQTIANGTDHDQL